MNTREGSGNQRTTNILSLVTAIVALAAAVIGFWHNAEEIRVKGKEIRLQGKQIQLQGKDIQTLKMAVDRARLGLAIESPRKGEIISREIYNDMRGSFKGDIPDGYSLWVLAHDGYNYFLMYPPTQFTRTMGTWSQTNVRLATPGSWRLHVCLANANASRILQNKANQNNWAGFPAMPAGMETVRYVTVEKR